MSDRKDATMKPLDETNPMTDTEFCVIRVTVGTRTLLKQIAEYEERTMAFTLRRMVASRFRELSPANRILGILDEDITDEVTTVIPKPRALEQALADWGDDEDTLPNPPDYLPDFDEIDHGKMQKDAFSNGYAVTEYAFKEWQQTPEYLEKAADWEAYKTLDDEPN